MRDLLTNAHETVESDLSAWHQTVSLSPALHRGAEPDVTVYWSDATDPGGNVLADARIPADQVSIRVPELLTPYLDRALPFQWVTTPRTTSPALEATLAQLGLAPRTASAMLVALDRPVDPQTPENTFIEVAWPDQLQAVASVLGPATHLPVDTREAHLAYLDGLTGPDSEECEFLVARDLGTSDPLGAVMMFRRRSSVIVPALDLLEEGARRRVTRPLIATLVNRAREGGARSITAVATDEHYEAFADLGFRTQFDVVSWVWTPTA